MTRSGLLLRIVATLWLETSLIIIPACHKQATQPAPASDVSEPALPQPAPPQQNAEDSENTENTDPTFLEHLRKDRWTGDLDRLRDRRYIRALVIYNKTYFFYDGPQPKGATYEALRDFEKFLNAKLNTGNKPLHIVFIPVSHDEAFKRMREGRGDIAAMSIAITPEGQKVFDLTDPIRENARELIVTGPSAPPIASLDDLSGQEIYVRKVSRYWPNLEHLNQRFRSEGKPEMILIPADENLEDEDILDMVHAGDVGITVVDNVIAGFWSKVFDEIKVHNDLSIADDDKIGWAVQKNTPQLLSLLNDFIKDRKVGTAYANILLQKYFKDTKWAKNNTALQEMVRFKGAAAFFRKYAALYKFDWLMIAAQAYQESQIDQSKVSSAGAVGVMQIKPETAAADPIDIKNVDKDMEKNINAGVKYLHFIINNYFKHANMSKMNRGLFAFASYNAGPNRIARLRKQAEREGLDPNKWFDNVELVAAKDIGAETVTYVSNIYKYFVAYRLVLESNERKRKSHS